MTPALQRWPRYVPAAQPAVTLDELERFLLVVFLRRYVTYCVAGADSMRHTMPQLLRRIAGQ